MKASSTIPTQAVADLHPVFQTCRIEFRLQRQPHPLRLGVHNSALEHGPRGSESAQLRCRFQLHALLETNSINIRFSSSTQPSVAPARPVERQTLEPSDPVHDNNVFATPSRSARVRAARRAFARRGVKAPNAFRIRPEAGRRAGVSLNQDATTSRACIGHLTQSARRADRLVCRHQPPSAAPKPSVHGSITWR